MNWHPLKDVRAFFGDESRYRNALIGGLAGGIGGAVGTLVETGGLPERLLLTGVVAVAVAIALVLLIGRVDRQDGD